MGITIVSNEEAERCEYVICYPANWPQRPDLFLTNEAGRCSKCQRDVVFRPYMPKNPPKLCFPCFARLPGADPTGELQEHVKRQEDAARQLAVKQ